MLVIASNAVDKKQRVYHRYGCMYARRIKFENRMEINSVQAEEKHYKECKYCTGLKGDIRVHKTAFATWSRKKNVSFTYKGETDTLYIQTEIGFWKVFMRQEIGKYLLYHRNAYFQGMEFREAINGEFHRQLDVKATESMEKIVEYIIAHDRAKVTIMDDYRKLPKSTKRQKKYFKAAKRREERKTARRLESLFLMIENREDIKKYHIVNKEKMNMKKNELLNNIYYEQKATNRNLQKLTNVALMGMLVKMTKDAKEKGDESGLKLCKVGVSLVIVAEA